MNYPKLTIGTVLLIGANGLISPAVAQGVDYVLRGGVTYSDNVERLPSGFENSSSAGALGLEMRGERPTGRLRYEIATDLWYYDYFADGLDSELLGRAALSGSYDFVPETFTWNASVDFDQLREDLLRPTAPGNLDEQLMYSTGPTLRARFGSAMEGQLDASYARVDYGSRPFDSETVGGRAMLARRANPRSMLGLGVAYDDVGYLSGPNASALDYERQEAFGRMEIAGVRTEVELEAGYAEVSGQSVDDGGPLLRARLMRRMTPTLSGHLSAVREYPTSDATRMSDPTIAAGGSYDSSLLTAAPRIATSFEAGLKLDRPRTHAEIAYTLHEDESLIAGLGERNYDELRGRVARDFTPKAQGSLYAVLSKEDFSVFLQEYDETIFGASLAVTFGQALGLELRIEHRDRDSDLQIDQYSELSGGLFIRYAGSLGGGRQAR